MSVYGAGGTALKVVEGKRIDAVSGMGAFGNSFVADKIPSKPDCYALHHPTWLETERNKNYTKEQYLQWTLWMIEVFKTAKNDCLNESPMDEITQRMGGLQFKAFQGNQASDAGAPQPIAAYHGNTSGNRHAGSSDKAFEEYEDRFNDRESSSCNHASQEVSLPPARHGLAHTLLQAPPTILPIISTTMKFTLALPYCNKLPCLYHRCLLCKCPQLVDMRSMMIKHKLSDDPRDTRGEGHFQGYGYQTGGLRLQY